MAKKLPDISSVFLRLRELIDTSARPPWVAWTGRLAVRLAELHGRRAGSTRKQLPAAAVAGWGGVGWGSKKKRSLSADASQRMKLNSCASQMLNIVNIR